MEFDFLGDFSQETSSGAGRMRSKHKGEIFVFPWHRLSAGMMLLNGVYGRVTRIKGGRFLSNGFSVLRDHVHM